MEVNEAERGVRSERAESVLDAEAEREARPEVVGGAATDGVAGGAHQLEGEEAREREREAIETVPAGAAPPGVSSTEPTPVEA